MSRPIDPVGFSFEITKQPNDTTCGPTCLHAIYRYYGFDISLDTLLREIPTLEQGGTLAVLLGTHALQHGFDVTLYTFNLRFVDPTWFFPKRITNLEAKLEEQIRIHRGKKRKVAARAYLNFLRSGGDLRMEDLSSELLTRHLAEKFPILTGLSSTWLYRCMRELPETNEEDDVHGEPAGHFVVVNGYDPKSRTVNIADPYEEQSTQGQLYTVPITRLVNAVLLGILTYDANLLIIRPKKINAN